MDRDPFKKVRPGERLEIPAVAFNAFADAARGFRDSAHDRDRAPAAAAARQATIVRVSNNSGGTCTPFEVLGLGAAMPTPTDNVDLFRDRVGFVGETPAAASHVGKFCLLLEPAVPGAVAYAVVAGVCPAKVYVTNAAHEYADVADGQTGYLASATRGAAQILWREAGTGEKWAIVRLGVLPAPGVCWGTAIAAWLPGEDHVHLDPCVGHADNTDNGLPEVHGYLISPTGDTPGAAYDIEAGDILAYVPFGANEGIIVNANTLPADLAFGVAEATWEHGVATIELDPCVGHDDNTDNGLPNVTGHIVSPTGAMPGARGLHYDIAINDIVAYIPFGTNQGLILNANAMLPAGTTGAIQYFHGDGYWTKLAISDNDKILQAKAGVPTWQTVASIMPAGDTGDLLRMEASGFWTALGGTTGDVLWYNGSKWKRLSIGTHRQVLQAVSATDVGWGWVEMHG